MLEDHLIVTGKIESLQDGIFICSGLNQCFVGEVIAFGSILSDLRGIVMDITQSFVKVVHLSGDFKKGKVGDIAYRTYHSFTTIAGFGVLGLALSILGECLNVEDLSKDDFSKHILSLEMIPVSAKAPSIIMREPVRIPVYTGVTSIDTLIPVGKGQRELLIGDKGVGKTTLALTIILHQRRFNNLYYWRECERLTDYEGFVRNFVPCFYVTIGQRRVEVARLKNLLLKNNALYYTCIVYAGCDSPAAVQYMAPYTACAMGEWFRGRAYNAIIVYDDLTQHAIAYRQMSLLLRRPPGREAYPGDIFYIHSRLLERAAQLTNVLGGGSLTAFPVIETKSGDISAYIPTNVISITDGQIFLSKEIMNKGIRPAVNLKLSVSRVGAAAQVPAMSYVSKFLKRQYSMYKRYEGIDRLGGDIDSYVMEYIVRGRNIDRYFIQAAYKTRKSFYSIVPIFLLCSGYLDSINSSWVTGYIKFILNKKVITFFSNKVNVDFILNIPILEALVESEPFYLLESAVKELGIKTPSIFNRIISFLNEVDGSKYYFNKLMY